MFCSNCGATINEGAKFCMSCGTPMASAAIPTEINVPTVTPVPTPVPAQPLQPQAYAPPPPPEPVYTPPPEPVYTPPPQAYAPPPPPPEPVYTPPVQTYAPPPPPQEPVYTPPPEPVYTPPPQQYAPPPPPQPQPTQPPPPPPQPQGYAPQPYGQPQASPYTPVQPATVPPTPAGSGSSGSKPSFLGGLADKLGMPVLMIIGGVALLLVVFSSLWLFTGVFSPNTDAGKVPDRVASDTTDKKDSEQEKEQDNKETPGPEVHAPTSGLQGFYALIEMSVDGQDFLDMYESMGINIASFYIEILSDSTLNIVTMGDATECSFSLDGNTITITDNDGSEQGTVEGNKITLVIEGMTMVFEWDPYFVPSSNPMLTDPGTDSGTDPGAGDQDGSVIPGEGGDVRVNEESVYEFSPNITGVWSIWTAYNNDCDPTLSVYTSGGGELAWDDDSAGNLNALIGLYLTAGETYTIRAGAFGSNVSYSLFVALSPSIWESGDTVSVNTPKVFSFKPYDSGTWMFETTNNRDVDPYLMIVDSNNRHLVSDDDSGEGMNARIAIDLEGGKEYIVLALAIDDEIGPYDLVVSIEG